MTKKRFCSLVLSCIDIVNCHTFWTFYATFITENNSIILPHSILLVLGKIAKAVGLYKNNFPNSKARVCLLTIRKS